MAVLSYKPPFSAVEVCPKNAIGFNSLSPGVSFIHLIIAWARSRVRTNTMPRECSHLSPWPYACTTMSRSFSNFGLLQGLNGKFLISAKECIVLLLYRLLCRVQKQAISVVSSLDLTWRQEWNICVACRMKWWYVLPCFQASCQRSRSQHIYLCWQN